MGRPRDVIVEDEEDIVCFEHHLAGSFVRVLIGFGATKADGSFAVAENQNYEGYVIQGKEYDSLMAATDTKPAGVFRKEDLWPFVDRGRQAVLAERQRIKFTQESPNTK